MLDANVVISALLRPEGAPGQVLDRFLTGQSFDLVVSPAILQELRRTLRYPRVTKYLRLSPDQVERRLMLLELLAETVAGARRIRVVAADPEDDKYLVAAIEGRAQFVVTGDRHLLSLGDYEGIGIVTPREFVSLLG